MSYVIRPVIVIVKYRVENLLQSLDNIGLVVYLVVCLVVPWSFLYSELRPILSSNPNSKMRCGCNIMACGFHLAATRCWF